jgi:D-ribulokinase
MELSLGIDFGTSGARAIVIDNDRNICWSGRSDYGHPQSARIWQNALEEIVQSIPLSIKKQIGRIAIDGTSSTVLLLDDQGQILGEPLLYSDDRGRDYLNEVGAIAPLGHQTHSATSSLAKLLWYSHQSYFGQARYLLHQADWLAALLHGQWGYSDYHNALKLGYDPVHLEYPDWLCTSPYAPLLPTVMTPGRPLFLTSVSYGFAPNCRVCAGTTDSIAAFAATGASQPGEAVTSLGSTLVLKLLSKIPVTSVEHGVYSHRWGNLWLTGGASNSGGAVLRHFFSNAELNTLSQQIDDHRLIGDHRQQNGDLDYYPLLKPGERFPINDPDWLPRMEPRPSQDSAFLQGLLIGMAKIEAQGYQLLQNLGASPVTQVYSAGGGAQNLVWQKIRQRYLAAPIEPAKQQEAAYGAALLAQGQIWHNLHQRL